MLGIFDYRILDESSFASLQQYNYLSQEKLHLEKHITYYFYYRSHLYGMYELHKLLEGRYYLKKNHYHPIYYYVPLPDQEACKRGFEQCAAHHPSLQKTQ